MKKKTIQGVYVVFLVGCLMLVGLLTPSWGANKAEMNLIGAAMKVNLVLVKSLIEAGADVNAKDYTGTTALMWASLDGHVGWCKHCWLPRRMSMPRTILAPRR